MLGVNTILSKVANAVSTFGCEIDDQNDLKLEEPVVPDMHRTSVPLLMPRVHLNSMWMEDA